MRILWANFPCRKRLFVMSRQLLLVLFTTATKGKLAFLSTSEDEVRRWKKDWSIFFLYRAAYHSAALALRDRLIVAWNKTQQHQTVVDQKRVYCKFLLWLEGPWFLKLPFIYSDQVGVLLLIQWACTDLSLEFLMGRTLDNAMLNTQVKDIARGKL